MLITWCARCLGIAIPHISGAKSKVRWRCLICSPSRSHIESNREVLGREFVEVIEEPVNNRLYKLWAAVGHALELAVMAGEPVPYGREKFYRDAGLEVPLLPVRSTS